MAEEACLEIDSDLDVPRVRLVKAGEEGIENFKSFAHAELDLGGSGGDKFPGGSIKVEIDGKTTYISILVAITSTLWDVPLVLIFCRAFLTCFSCSLLTLQFLFSPIGNKNHHD